MEKLLPCPWVNLGGPHMLRININRGYVMVICGCGARGPSNYSKESAIEAWNKRTPPEAT
jgi:hypothetical protein